MVLAFQLFFFIIVIGSSFFGLGAFFTTVFFSLLFTLSNVFTLPLLLLQSSVILFAGAIGFFIACIVSLKNSSFSVKNHIQRSDKSLLKKGILYVVFLIITIFIYRKMYYFLSCTVGMTISKWILFAYVFYFVVISPKKIMYYFQLYSGRFIITLIILGVLKYFGFLTTLRYLFFGYGF